MAKEEVVRIAFVTDHSQVNKVHLSVTKGLAIGSIFNGVVSVILGTTLLYCSHTYAPADIGYGIWTGVLVIATAAVGLTSVIRLHSSAWNIAHVVLNGVCCLPVFVSLCLSIASTVLFSKYTDDIDCIDVVLLRDPHNGTVPLSNGTTQIHQNLNTTSGPTVLAAPSCAGPPHNWKWSLIIYAILCFIMISQLALSITAIVLSCIRGGCCKCCRNDDLPYEKYVNGEGAHEEQATQASRIKLNQGEEWSNPTLHFPNKDDISEKKPLGVFQ